MSNSELPTSWVKCELNDLTLRISNGANVKQFDEKVGLPISRIETIWNQLIDENRVKYIQESDDIFVTKYCLKNGYILFSHINSDAHLGKTAIYKGSPPNLIHGVNLLLIRFSSEVSKQFMNYQFNFLRAKGAFVEVAQRAVNQSSINQKTLKRTSFFLPPINEQTRIAGKIEELFTELDRGVESLKTAREQLKVYRQALLKQAFEGKLTEQWRKDNPDKLESAEHLLERIKQERENSYEKQLLGWNKAVKLWENGGRKDKKPTKPKTLKNFPAISANEYEALPSLPDQWQWIRLGELFDISPQNGIYKPASEYGSGNYIIRIDDFYDGELVKVSGFKRLNLSENELAKYAVSQSNILVNRVNSIEYLGKCCEVKDLAEPTVFESNIMKLSIVERVISVGYVVPYLASHEGRTRLCSNAKHAVNQASINQTDVGMTLVPICDSPEQDVIINSLKNRLSIIASQLEQITIDIQKAYALRQSILKFAFAGQLVSQNEDDEPARELLLRIQKERENT